MFAARNSIFPGTVVVAALASVIVLYAISIVQDVIRDGRFSLGHLLAFVTIVALLLGAAVMIWRLL